MICLCVACRQVDYVLVPDCFIGRAWVEHAWSIPSDHSPVCSAVSALAPLGMIQLHAHTLAGWAPESELAGQTSSILASMSAEWTSTDLLLMSRWHPQSPRSSRPHNKFLILLPAPGGVPNVLFPRMCPPQSMPGSRRQVITRGASVEKSTKL